MQPEQPGTGFAPRRQRADSSPWGTLSTGLLRGLIQSVGPPFFCPLLPRVQAADVAAAQPAQMPSSSSSSNSPAPISMPSHMGRPEFPDAGWDRIKDLFDKDVTQRHPEELTNVIKSGVAAALAGLLYGGLPAARHARQRYIQLNQAEIYTSRVEAVRSAHNAAIRGFVRYGWRWSWRVAAFVTLFNSVSTGLSVYRDKYTLSHYAAAGGESHGLQRGFCILPHCRTSPSGSCSVRSQYFLLSYNSWSGISFVMLLNTCQSVCRMCYYLSDDDMNRLLSTRECIPRTVVPAFVAFVCSPVSLPLLSK
ncbi:complex I assembly factor TIMMDC1, mitochondrial isoform X2 [Anarrhichthys ocellatus]|uniref:complex I assembly factor TIMMDC1, mitochondrial isoform X2 n=1 Tax=Anarrhichthys ocellatus TaxID=433405 RepID=UPI0012ECF1DB|nr:complex I assembly factor TIMMDC1, mitochondrial isoform X2 [Anarrhichthys ocellatus]